MVAISSSMRITGLPVPPSFSTQQPQSAKSMQIKSSSSPGLNKGITSGSKVISRFFVKDRTGKPGTVEVCYFSSSNVQVAMFDHKRQVLSITLKGGGRVSVYEYYNVPKEYWEAMKKASSAGRYVYYSVRKRFMYRRVR